MAVTVLAKDASGHSATKVADPGLLRIFDVMGLYFPAGPLLNTMAGICFAESWSSITRVGGYIDAVGDISLQTDVWGPSVGLAQVRTMKNPPLTTVDKWRDATKLRDLTYYAQACWEISRHGTRFDQWSVFKNNNSIYFANIGNNFQLRVGHERASSWPVS